MPTASAVSSEVQTADSPVATHWASLARLREEIAAPAVREHFYVTLLGLRTFEGVDLHERVQEGLSHHATEKLRRTLDLSTTEFAPLIGIPSRTLARRKETGRLEPDESDRLLRLARITGLTLQLFEGELEPALTWLKSPLPGLGGAVPIRLAGTEVGAREVEHLLGRLEHGIPL